MAILLLGTLASDVRGSIGGTTYARNKAGAYARNRTVPVNPNTPSQSQNRAQFGNNSSLWTALAPSDQSDWNHLAQGATRQNALGQPYTPSGRQLFMESAQNLALTGNPPLTAAPGSADIPPGPDPACAIAVTVLAGVTTALTIAGGPAVIGLIAVVRGTPQNPGPKTNFTNQYRNFAALNSADPLNILSSYTNQFGTVAGTPGNTLSMMMSYVDTVTGFRSAELRIDTVWP